MRYPIGPFTLPDAATATAQRMNYLADLQALPAAFAQAALDLQSRGLLDTPYREGGWTARQVIHHVADSHVNAYVRHKRVLTEDHPTLPPYDEKAWAELPDVAEVPIEVSLELLRGLHQRWTTILAACTDADWERTAHHGGSGWTYRLDTLAAHYSWHGKHHLGHLQHILANH